MSGRETTMKFVWCLLFLLVNTLIASAQYINVHLTDSTTNSYGLADLQRITYDEDELIMKFISGDSLTWNFSSIQHVDYDDLNLGIESPTSENMEFLVYPNPSSEDVNIQLTAPMESDLWVDIYDLSGRHVSAIFSGSARGLLNLRWNGKDAGGSRVSQGVYFCTVQLENHRISRTIIRVDR